MQKPAVVLRCEFSTEPVAEIDGAGLALIVPIGLACFVRKPSRE